MSWLRDRRTELKLSQDDIATRLQLEGWDVSRGMVSHWENSRHPMPLQEPQFVSALARILRLDVTTVLVRSGYAIPSQHGEVSERIARIVDTFDETKQALALRLVEQLME